MYLIGTAINSVSNLGYMREEEEEDRADEYHRPCLSGAKTGEGQFGFNLINQINVDGFEWDLI